MSQPPAARLPLRDTHHAYGRLTRLLHWSIAALLLWQFLGMGLRLIFGRQDWVGFFVGSHQPVGAVLFLLILARVLWAITNRRNRPSHGTGLMGLCVKAGHGILYLLMLVVPFVALLRAWGGTRGFAPFGIPVFAPREEEIAWTQSLAGAVHGEGAWVLLAAILGHVVMVGVHEGMWRDGTLSRMAGRARPA